jgi:HSP20 family protein
MKTTHQIESSKNVGRAKPAEFVTPEVNIFETPEGYLIEAEMPGVNKDGLEITIEGNEITILGRRTEELTTAEALLRERNGADFRRVFELDPAIDTSKISAKMNQGVLTLSLPKSEELKPRKILVAD